MTGLHDGRAVVVTGAGQGIGRSAALAFAREGADVAVLDADADAAAETAAMVTSAGRDAVALACDVADGEAVERAFAGIDQRFGRLDRAYNNAGIRGPFGTVADYGEADWRRVIDVDLNGLWLCLRAELRRMTRGGSIVNCSAGAGVSGFPPELPALVAAKHGVEGITKSTALQYGPHGIRVNAVRPGAIRTPAFAAAVGEDPGFESRLAALHPIGRIGLPEEVAEAVVWLASDRASFVTGSLLSVDGGFLTR